MTMSPTMAEAMPFTLRDTRTRQRRPLPGGRAISLYVCGVTPYDTTHLGHAFTYVQFDTLVRALRWLGHEVVYVQNVTDIDDSILARSRQLGVGWRELGDAGLQRYLADMRALNVADPTLLVPATTVMPSIVEMTRRLLDAGAAYEADGGTVYFRVRSSHRYGELSGLDPARMLEIAGQQDDADLDAPGKEDPLDPVLWKAWSGDPLEPHWPSPWGEGRPGWHVECAAINLVHLGPQIDLHGGGADLVFPHHETEIALMEATTGRRPFVGTWLHTGMVREAGEKMSKSLGNMVFASDLVARFGGDAVRLYLLSHHYREELEYREEEMVEAADRWERLRSRHGEEHDGSADTEAAREAFRAALEDDLDAPRALQILETCRGRVVRELAAVLGLTGLSRTG
jgi:L-cysteine:1D-myo-inositol 2-amino-2-deoxy-alpha-D-glucopyranoside ligase